MSDFITKEDFIAYLNTLPPEHVFHVLSGQMWEQCCPLASCLKTKGHADPRCGLSVWFPSPKSEAFRLPAWAATFIRRIDKVVHDYVENDVTFDTDITVAKSLEALNGL